MREPVGPGQGGGGDARGQHQEGVETPDLRRAELGRVLGQELPLDPRRLVEEAEADVAEAQSAFGIQEIPGHAHTEDLAHARPSASRPGPDSDCAADSSIPTA